MGRASDARESLLYKGGAGRVSTGLGNARTPTLPLYSVCSFASAAAFFTSQSGMVYTQTAGAAWSTMRRRSTGSASWAFLLKPNAVVEPGSCQPG